MLWLPIMKSERQIRFSGRNTSVATLINESGYLWLFHISGVLNSIQLKFDIVGVCHPRSEARVEKTLQPIRRPSFSVIHNA